MFLANDQQWVRPWMEIHIKNLGWQDCQGGQEKMEEVQTDRGGPLLLMDVQAPSHTLHE